MSSKWISALQDLSNTVNTFPACVGLSDLQGDGEYLLVIGDIGTGRYNMRLKVFRALTLVGESVLTDLPSAVVPFINELMHPVVPSIAIASGHSVLIYKNLKPFYKFSVPAQEINQAEAEAWQHVHAHQIDVEQLYAVLSKLGEQFGLSSLTGRSQTFVMSEEGDREALLERFRGEKLVKQSTITCMCTLKKSSSEASGVDAICFGTEGGAVYCIDSQAFTVLSQCTISGVPVFIHANGVYDVDYRIYVSTRDAEIFVIKRGVNELQKPLLSLRSIVIGITRVGKQLVVACDDGTVTFYSSKGRRQSEIKMELPIKGIETFTYAPRQYVALLVALANEIRIYRENFLMDRLKIEPEINWIKFGCFGREEGALIIGTKNGGLIVKLFRRTAKLEGRPDELGPPAAQNRRLNVPKRTKIFVDQTIREREQAQSMHQIAQRDLFMLRLSVTRAFAELTHESLNTLSTKKNEAVEISVEVNGFGPFFRMIVKLRAASAQPLEDHWLAFHYDSEQYSFNEPLIPVPALVSGMTYTFANSVECLRPEKGLSSDVRVLLVFETRVVVAAVVTMPVSEINLLN